MNLVNESPGNVQHGLGLVVALEGTDVGGSLVLNGFDIERK